MHSSWETCELGDLVELKRGYDLPKRSRRDGDVPIVSSSGLSGEHNASMVDPPGVVTGRYGTLGEFYFLEEPFWPLNTTLYVRDFKGNDEKFVYYFLQSLDLASFSDKAAVPGINRNHVHTLSVKAPRDPDEQREIASILSSLDDKIELNGRMSRTLESLARAVFRSWFVDFEPVRANAEAAGHPNPLGPPSGGYRPLPPDLASLFPDRFTDSNLGQIPEGWEAKRLDEVADVVSGGTPRKSNQAYWGGDIPWVSPKAMNHIHASDSDDKVTEAAIGNGTKLVREGTTLIMVRGMGLHEGVRVSQARCDVSFNQDVKALVPTDIEPDLLLFGVLDATDRLHGRVRSSGHGTGVLSTDSIKETTLNVPPPSCRTEFADFFTTLNTQIDACRRNSDTLSSTRDALLPKLMSGEVCVGEAKSSEAAS